MEENNTQINQNQMQPIAEQMPQPAVQQPKIAPPTPSPGSRMPKIKMPKINFKMPKFSKRSIIIGAAIFVVLIILIVLMGLMRRLPGVSNIIPIPTESPTPAPTINTEQPSPYADDPDVLKIKDGVDSLDQELNNTQLREDTLRVPALDWDINFK